MKKPNVVIISAVANNNWSKRLALWFMSQHPKAEGFFETRERRSPVEDDK